MSKKNFLILVTFIVGMCSIIYELLISTVSSYFLGNSVKQFSLIIGIYMAAMGLGAYFSRWIKGELLYKFILTELILGFIGAFSVPLCYLYFLYADFQGYNIFVLSLVGVIGVLTGLEVPLITRVLESDLNLKENISVVLSFDYLGALLATLLFPFLLLPFVGSFKTSLIFGQLNLIVGALTFICYRDELGVSKAKKRLGRIIFGMGTVMIVACIFFTKQIIDRWHYGIFKYPVVYSEESSYQDIVVTSTDHEFRLYLNGAIQFSSRDEYRYHEALVHPTLMQFRTLDKVLILGGGEGLAAREVLKHSPSQVDLVDLDPSITKLSNSMSTFVDLNKGALDNPAVNVHNEDAFLFVMTATEKYDAIIIDLPDPSTESLAKLYSKSFYGLCKETLNPGGVLVTQSTSPTLTPNAFWCIDTTLAVAGFEHRVPYHLNIPSFGEWGFIMCAEKSMNHQFDESIDCEFLEESSMHYMTHFPKDMDKVKTDPNFLDQPTIFNYYLEHWQSLSAEKR